MIDDKVSQILKLLDEKKIKYPNLTNVWNQFISNQLQYLQQTLEQCDKVFKNIENNTDKDLKQETILMLYLLKNNYNLINNDM